MNEVIALLETIPLLLAVVFTVYVFLESGLLVDKLVCRVKGHDLKPYVRIHYEECPTCGEMSIRQKETLAGWTECIRCGGIFEP
jgi:hypothetical protein